VSKYWKMRELSDFERGQTIGVRLAGASVTIHIIMFIESDSLVMSAYTNHGKTSVKQNSGQKLTFTETDHCTLRRTVSQNHKTTAV
jgi:hypothetical protein